MKVCGRLDGKREDVQRIGRCGKVYKKGSRKKGSIAKNGDKLYSMETFKISEVQCLLLQ